MKFQICVALITCLLLGGCGRCWDDACTQPCESLTEENGNDVGHNLADTTDSDAVEDDGTIEIGDITVEDAISDVETEDSIDVSNDVETSDL